MIIVIDLEATCWDNNDYKQQNEMEIIEIGSIILNDNLEVIKSISIFVKPVLNPVLSDFCKNFTSIKQEDIDEAQKFPQALQDLIRAIKNNLCCSDTLKEQIMASWGDYDRKQLIKDCYRHQIEYPFEKHWNVKLAFSKKQGVKKRFGLGRALKRVNLDFEGTSHRGIDDAINIARIIKEYFGNEYKNYF